MTMPTPWPRSQWLCWHQVRKVNDYDDIVSADYADTCFLWISSRQQNRICLFIWGPGRVFITKMSKISWHCFFTWDSATVGHIPFEYMDHERLRHLFITIVKFQQRFDYNKYSVRLFVYCTCSSWSEPFYWTWLLWIVDQSWVRVVFFASPRHQESVFRWEN